MRLKSLDTCGHMQHVYFSLIQRNSWIWLKTSKLHSKTIQTPGGLMRTVKIGTNHQILSKEFKIN